MSYNGGGSEDISAKVFVAGLSRSITERDLKDSFEKYGPIKEVRVVMDRATQESKGFGFVTYEEIRDAEDAIAGMDNRDLDGRTVHCAKAKPKREGGDRRGGGGGYGGGGYGGGGRSYGGGDRGYSGGGGGRGYGGGGNRSYGGGGRGGGGGGYGGQRDSYGSRDDNRSSYRSRDDY